MAKGHLGNMLSELVERLADMGREGLRVRIDARRWDPARAFRKPGPLPTG